MATTRRPAAYARACTRLWRAILVASAGALVAPAAGAQHLPTGPAVERALHDSALVTQIPGSWVASRATSDTRLTAAERTAMQNALTQIAALWRTSLGPLPGVEANESQNEDQIALADGAHVAGGTVKVLLWPYAVRNGKLAFYDNAARAIFWVNHAVCAGDAIGPTDAGFLLAPRRTGSFHGFPMLDSIVVVTHRTAPPCVPVTRGEFLQAFADRMTRDAAHDDSAFRADSARRERDLAAAARTNPQLVATARAEMARMTQMSDSIRTATRRTFTDALARMSPAERAMPAYVAGSGCQGDGSDPTSCFVDASAADARAVVRPNPAFLDAARASDVQVVTLDLREIADGRQNAAYPTSVMEASLDRFDWNALSALVH